MKITLEFNLPEDQTDFELASQGNKWWSVAWKMDQWLRGQTKHPPEHMSDGAYEAFEECRKQLRRLIDEYNLDLEK